jgi:GDP-L-fucose synthase
MKTDSRIAIMGAAGLVGSSIVRRLAREGCTDVLTVDIGDVDLTDKSATLAWFTAHRPQFVFLAAAKVGGIVANDRYPADFIRINLEIQTNVIDAAYRTGVSRLLFLGSSCIYPKHAPQPMKEEHLLTGVLEPTNDAYAIAKIAGIVMCRSYNHQHGTDFVAAMPTNLYGPGDNFDLETSHVMPAMIARFHAAREQNLPSVTLWGTGTPRREFLHVDDLADALVFVMRRFTPDDQHVFVNVGLGEDVSILELSQMIKEVVGYNGDILWNTEMPDGTPRKLLDVSRLSALGWRASISLKDGIESTYRWYLAQRLK